jgi:O-antigen/teichoic acid export membrane protein
MPLVRTLVRNIASNWVGYGVQTVVAFFLTPFILRSLGETRYGVWVLVMGLTGYYGLLDLGLSAGITQYLTRYRAAQNVEKLNQTASTGFLALTCCGVVVFIGSLAVALNASFLFQISQESATEVALVILITGISVAMQFIFFIYSAVFTAVQRFDLSNAIGIATRLVSAAATVLCLNLGYGLIGLSLVLAGTNLMDYLLRWRVSTRLLPSMKISLKLATPRNLSEVLKFGLWNTAITGSVRLISYTDAIVIAAFMPVSAVAPFAIAANLRSYFEDIFVRAGFVFFPVATELDAKGDQDGLRTLYLVSSKFMLLGSILCGSMGILWARDFFRLWLGAAYAEPVGYPSVASIFYLLILGSMVSVAQRIGYQVLLGTREVGLLAALFAAEGVANLVMSIVLVRSYGLIGIAIGTLVPAVLFEGIVQPYFVCRSLQISLNRYCQEVLLRPAIVLLALAPIYLTSPLWGHPGEWAAFFLGASASFAVAAPIVLLIGLRKSERDTLVVRPATAALGNLTINITRRRRTAYPPVKNKFF